MDLLGGAASRQRIEHARAVLGDLLIAALRPRST